MDVCIEKILRTFGSISYSGFRIVKTRVPKIHCENLEINIAAKPRDQ